LSLRKIEVLSKRATLRLFDQSVVSRQWLRQFPFVVLKKFHLEDGQPIEMQQSKLFELRVDVFAFPNLEVEEPRRDLGPKAPMSSRH
jgi:hypothetical protein